MIAQLDVTDQPNDYHSLESNIEALKDQLGITPETVLADKGYANEDQIQSLEPMELVVLFLSGTSSWPKTIDAGITLNTIKRKIAFVVQKDKSFIWKIKNLLNEANHTADIKAKIAMNVH